MFEGKQHLIDVGKLYNATVLDHETHIKVRLSRNFSFMRFEGVDQYSLAANYIITGECFR